jgi:OPA family sugar phosphate sensor protein UhpC-like MFS transporter
MLELFWKVFATGQDKPLISTDNGVIAKEFNKRRWQVFTSITLGYALFYVLRLNFSVIKKPLMSAGILNAQELGLMGSVFFITYGLGKFINSFLADRMNNKKFFALGLFV